MCKLRTLIIDNNGNILKDSVIDIGKVTLSVIDAPAMCNVSCYRCFALISHECCIKIAQSIRLLYDAHQSRTDGYIDIG